MKTKTKVELAGATAATAGALGAAYYFFGAKGAKKHRKEAVVWMTKAEKEIMAEAKKLKNATFNEKNYKKIVATVAAKYKALPKIDQKDVAHFHKALTSAWKELKNVEKKLSPVKKAAKKTVHAAKKTAAKRSS